MHQLLSVLLLTDEECFTELGWVLQDIKSLIQSLGKVSFCLTTNSCNCATQALVGFAKEREESLLWLEECSSLLFPIQI
jgi:hypothetical protein